MRRTSNPSKPAKPKKAVKAANPAPSKKSPKSPARNVRNVRKPLRPAKVTANREQSASPSLPSHVTTNLADVEERTIAASIPATKPITFSSGNTITFCADIAGEGNTAADAFVRSDLDLSDISPAFHDILRDLESRRIAASDAERDAIALRKSIDEDITSLLADLGCTHVHMPDGYVICLQPGASASTLSATRLLELGVPADTIAAATVPGKRFTSVRVRPLTDKESEQQEIREGAVR